MKAPTTYMVMLRCLVPDKCHMKGLLGEEPSVETCLRLTIAASF
jgi:hypothetical protein